MDVKKTIMFIAPSMRAGGTERVISILIRYLSREKFNIVLVLLKKEGKYLDDLPNDINIIDLNVKGARFAVFKVKNIINKFKPDIVLSAMAHVSLLIAILKPFLPRETKFFARESTIPSVHNKNTKYPKILDFLYKIFYNNFDLIVCQSDYMKDDLVSNYKIKKNKMIVINNPVDTEFINKLLIEDIEFHFNKNKINLLAVGRLGKEKGFDLLLQALSKLESKYHLTILGEGNEKDELERLAKNLNIEDRISLLGFQENPYKYMLEADLFILSSRYEGFPNVVLEANACGIPVVAFNCPGGTGEIIENGLNGFLVENGNIELLADRIRKSIDYEFNEKEIVEFVKKRYEVDLITKKYEKVFQDEKNK